MKQVTEGSLGTKPPNMGGQFVHTVHGPEHVSKAFKASALRPDQLRERRPYWQRLGAKKMT